MIDVIVWVAPGIGAYLFWARYVEHTWPYGPKEIKEEYRETRSKPRRRLPDHPPSQACDQFKPGGLPDTLRVNA